MVNNTQTFRKSWVVQNAHVSECAYGGTETPTPYQQHVLICSITNTCCLVRYSPHTACIPLHGTTPSMLVFTAQLPRSLLLVQYPPSTNVASPPESSYRYVAMWDTVISYKSTLHSHALHFAPSARTCQNFQVRSSAHISFQIKVHALFRNWDCHLDAHCNQASGWGPRVVAGAELGRPLVWAASADCRPRAAISDRGLGIICEAYKDKGANGRNRES